MASAMPEHLIRLRKAWELESPLGTPRGRLDLPQERLDLGAPFRLLRSWTAPAALAPDERVLLRLDRVPGLLSIQIDSVTRPPAGHLTLTAEPGRRSRLILTCDPTTLSEEQRLDWGHVALVMMPSPPSDFATI